MEVKEETFKMALDKLNAYLELYQHRKTQEREEILRAVCSIDTAFSIDELAHFMQEQSKFLVSRATLFSTLEIFEKVCLVIKHGMSREVRYEFTPTRKPLVYFVCDSCGLIHKFNRTEVTDFLDGVRSYQFTVRQPVLYLHGMCKWCERAMKRKERQLRSIAKTKLKSK